MGKTEQLKHISSYTSKLLRQKFGKGPESCHASYGSRYIVLYLRKFICPMEEVLLAQNQYETVTHSRHTIIETILVELKGVIQVTMDVEVLEFYHDWSYENNNGIIVAYVQDGQADFAPEESDFPEKTALEQEVSRLSFQLQKLPGTIESFKISPKIYIVIRYETLVYIEKALIHKGYGKVLKITKNEYEKKLLHSDGRFEQIFGNKVTDIFCDEDFSLDKALTIFFTK
ncbi:Na-translocating system protein MpsC family protein [Ammoniphilus sp. YIM 78166]|uniref:Na-translocating system protein MpsC family protein n=1 Tax=Ammoniphilus sp. YIM 78166 TaxID=1644106 RepID=UPI0014309F69|nr:Na-translocating system protein MpsC family protein [Ammoniphilus sp. YIM 78166]